MTREEAIWWLRKYRRDIPKFNYSWYGVLRKNAEFIHNGFEQYLVMEVIDRIQKEPDRDPIAIIKDIYDMTDDVLSESEDDHFITHNCASMMELIARDMLRYLREKELRKHEQN